MKTLTFAETLHPEYAQAQLDFQSHNESTSMWGTVYNETTGADYPSAVAEMVREDDYNAGAHNNIVNPEIPSPDVLVDIPDSSEEGRPHAADPSKRPLGKGCFYLEGVIGVSLTISAIAATFAIELTAAVVYSVAAGFYYVTTCGEIGILFRAVFLLVVQLLRIVDALLLTVSVIITEVLGVIASIVTIWFVHSCRTARDWHIYIRKACHLTRWAFRGFHEGWALERHFPVDVVEKKDKTDAGVPAPTLSSQSGAAVSPDPETPQPVTAKKIAAGNIVVVDHVTYENFGK